MSDDLYFVVCWYLMCGYGSSSGGDSPSGGG